MMVEKCEGLTSSRLTLEINTKTNKGNECEQFSPTEPNMVVLFNVHLPKAEAKIVKIYLDFNQF